MSVPLQDPLSSPVSSDQSSAAVDRYPTQRAAVLRPNVGGTAEGVLSSQVWDEGFFYTFDCPPSERNRASPALRRWLCAILQRTPNGARLNGELCFSPRTCRDEKQIPSFLRLRCKILRNNNHPTYIKIVNFTLETEDTIT